MGTHVKAAVRREAAKEHGWKIDSAEALFAFCLLHLTEVAAETCEAHVSRVKLGKRRFVWVPPNKVQPSSWRAAAHWSC